MNVRPGALHHVELWVPDLDRAVTSWGWLLPCLGYEPFQDWPGGRSWRLGDTYIVVEESPDLIPGGHERRRAGLNHLAFHVADAAGVDALVAEAPRHGWSLMFADRHPYAGGNTHYAAYMEDVDGFEVELVAITAPARSAGACRSRTYHDPMARVVAFADGSCALSSPVNGAAFRWAYATPTATMRSSRCPWRPA